MASPVDDPREEDAEREGRADDEQGVRAAARFAPASELGPGRGRDLGLLRLLIGGELAARACGYQARLQLPQERSVLRELLCDALADTAASGGLLGELLEAIGAPIDEGVGLVHRVRLVHRLTGGSSPVAIRQIRDEIARAATVAIAPNVAKSAVQRTLRSIWLRFTEPRLRQTRGTMLGTPS
jgi:hypothetical protein